MSGSSLLPGTTSPNPKHIHTHTHTHTHSKEKKYMENIWNSGFQNTGLLVTKDSNAEKGKQRKFVTSYPAYWLEFPDSGSGRALRQSEQAS